jgi:Bifunctional DNA primase/polymerase, N-terminal
LDATTDGRQVWRWWSRWPKASIGVACGHGCDVLDIDGAEGRDSLAKLLTEAGQDPSILDTWVTSSSGRPDGGLHCWFQPGGPIRWAGFRPGLDWCGLGGYIIAPPSIHQSGRTYRWSAGWAPGELPAAPAWLHTAATRPVREVRSPRLDPSGDGDRPGDAFNAAADWAELLTADGWRLERQVGDTSYWTRPGKARGVSASVGYQGWPGLHVFTGSVERLRADTGYTPFAYWAATRHGGDWEAAAKELYVRGYGEHRPHTGQPCARADCPNPRVGRSLARRRRP